jgi:initiation factor 1A
MVRNNGGNKAKKFASKSFNISEKNTRFSIDDDEVYAIINRMLGSNICEVLCIDGKTRLCIIRGKFSGKGKRDNRLFRGKWVLVGLRSWQVTSKEKEKCDLLEVYSDNDKEKLIKNSKQNFRIFLSVSSDGDTDHEQVQFINSREDELFFETNNDSNSELNTNKDMENSDENDDNDENAENDENDKNNKKDEKISLLIKQNDWINTDDI